MERIPIGKFEKLPQTPESCDRDPDPETSESSNERMIGPILFFFGTCLGSFWV